MQWEVPLEQQQSASSGSGPSFGVSWSSTGVKQVRALLDGGGDDVILYVFKNAAEQYTLGDLLDGEPPATPRGPEDYQWFRKRRLWNA